VTLVDTSSWIHFFRRDGHPEVKSRVQNLLNEGSAVICPVILAELWMGAGSEKDRTEVRRLKEAVVSLEIEGQVWDRCYRLAALCCRHGTPVPAGDLIIAACAFVFEVAIEASDKHFPILEKHRVASRV
jgi:predicted nucleic acid-binding protein